MLSELETGNRMPSDEQLHSILQRYLQIYAKAKKSNELLSFITGSIYCLAFFEMGMMIYSAFYSDATPSVKFIAISFAIGMALVETFAFNLAARLSKSSVSLRLVQIGTKDIATYT